MFRWFHVALILLAFIFTRYTGVIFFCMMYLCGLNRSGWVLVVWRVSIRARAGVQAGAGGRYVTHTSQTRPPASGRRVPPASSGPALKRLLTPRRAGLTAPSAALSPLPVFPSSLSQDTTSSVRLMASGLGAPPPRAVSTTRIGHLKRPRKTDSLGPQNGTLWADGPPQRCPGRDEVTDLCVGRSSWAEVWTQSHGGAGSVMAETETGLRVAWDRLTPEPVGGAGPQHLDLGLQA